jgi:hypothetical protein
VPLTVPPEQYDTITCMDGAKYDVTILFSPSFLSHNAHSMYVKADLSIHMPAINTIYLSPEITPTLQCVTYWYCSYKYYYKLS